MFQAKQWYYHYPEGSDSVAKSSNKGDSDIEPSTQVEVVENSETGLPEWAIVNQENQAEFVALTFFCLLISSPSSLDNSFFLEDFIEVSTQKN